MSCCAAYESFLNVIIAVFANVCCYMCKCICIIFSFFSFSSAGLDKILYIYILFLLFLFFSHKFMLPIGENLSTNHP